RGGKLRNEPCRDLSQERKAFGRRPLVETGVLDGRPDQRTACARHRVSTGTENDARWRSRLVRDHLPADRNERVGGDPGAVDLCAPCPGGDDDALGGYGSAIAVHTGCGAFLEWDAERSRPLDARAGTLERGPQRARQLPVVDDAVIGLPKREDRVRMTPQLRRQSRGGLPSILAPQLVRLSLGESDVQRAAARVA